MTGSGSDVFQRFPDKWRWHLHLQQISRELLSENLSVLGFWTGIENVNIKEMGEANVILRIKIVRQKDGLTFLYPVELNWKDSQEA